MRILILGGTTEARELAAHAARQRWRAVLSLAGVIAGGKASAAIPVRYGGFGGSAGMAEWINKHRISHLVDATHPFAERISANAARAADMTGVKRLVLMRPAWEPQSGDDWRFFDHMDALVDAIPDHARVFMAAGQQGIDALPVAPDFAVIARLLQPPAIPKPIRYVLSPPLGSADAEKAFMAAHGITHLVVKNSGGRADAKLQAARMLGLPVLMLKRPPPPPPPLYDSLSLLLAALAPEPDQGASASTA